jgi:hypothetical protein
VLQPWWAGVVTAEETRTEFGLVATARTVRDDAAPLRALVDALRAQTVRVDEQSAGGVPVLLIW